MRVAESTPESIELRGRGSVQTPLIVGSVLLCWPALAAVMAGSPPTGDRLLGAVVLAVSGSTLIWLGRPKSRAVSVDPRNRRIVAPDRAPWTISDGAVFHLVAAPSQPSSGPLRYGVALEDPGREPLLVLTGKDPARVLRDLVLLRASLRLPVLAGWGLSRRVIPWLDGDAPGYDEKRSAIDDDPVEPTRRRATTAVGVGTAGGAALLTMEIHGRASRGDNASPISLVLPALAVCVLAVLTVVLGSVKPRVSADPALVFEWRLGTLRLFPRTIPVASVASAAVVSPTGRAGRHLLMTTTDGAFEAFPCERSDGALAAERLSTGEHRAH
ncbi:MAG TPA: hypothetical protein VH062_12850 [Polyangiaceae bacterium]|jgi:hypothetical protein|nr:hypothetical protein [Polyangiaceae bacterium]